MRGYEVKVGGGGGGAQRTSKSATAATVLLSALRSAAFPSKFVKRMP